MSELDDLKTTRRVMQDRSDRAGVAKCDEAIERLKNTVSDSPTTSSAIIQKIVNSRLKPKKEK